MGNRHNDTKSGAYSSWSAMRRRCINPAHKSFAAYGGRGIKICSRWESYLSFRGDMGPRPLGTTLDRIDNNGNYEPSNCRWATRLEQVNNRRNSIKFEISGSVLTLREISERFGVRLNLLCKRIHFGWDVHRAIELPSQKLIKKAKRLSGKQLRDLSLRQFLAAKYPERANELL